MCQKFSTTANLILKPYSKLQNLRYLQFEFQNHWKLRISNGGHNFQVLTKSIFSPCLILVLSILMFYWLCLSLWYCLILSCLILILSHLSCLILILSCLLVSWYCLYFFPGLCLTLPYPIPWFFQYSWVLWNLVRLLIVGTMENSYWLTGAYFVEVKFWLKARS